MTDDAEKGFGTGLRAQLRRKRGEDAPVDPVEPVKLPLVGEPVVDVHAELAATRDRERGLLARVAELEQLAARGAEVEEREVVLRIQLDQLEAERSEVARVRTELVAEQARVGELARHVDSRSHELESADHHNAQAGAHLAQELAALAEGERELKREQAALDARRAEEESRIAAREDSLYRREQTLAERESNAHEAIAKLTEREQAVETREATFAKQSDARERMIANGEAALAAWERRLRTLGDRLEREQEGQGQASREALALLAELEQREETVGHREAKLAESEERIAARGQELEEAEAALRVRDARLHVDLDLRENSLEDRERAVEERERLLEMRERELAAYVGEVQSRFSESRDVA